jgi:hypothetical protein
MPRRIEWVQAVRHPTSKQRDPIQGEFFSTDSIPTLAAKLTREGIGQNPLDAAKELPVRVRVYVSGDSGAVAPSAAAHYFSGLRLHVEASDPEAATQFDNPCRFLLVEDFNTTGLVGDATATEEPPPGEANDFFYFFRAEGKSGKSGADRGRWGVGKYVFPMASHINTFFGLTVRVDNTDGDPLPLLMGQAVLKNHHLDGTSYEPDGWWAEFDGNGVPVPVTDKEVLAEFRQTWNISREQDLGLSIVIPYVRPDLDADSIKCAVIVDYFLAMLSDKFIVEIGSPELEDRIVITADKLEEAVETLPDPTERQDLRQQIALARWHLGLANDDFVRVKQVTSGSPRWHPELIGEVDRARIRVALSAGENVAVRVPVEVYRKKGDGTDGGSWSFFDVMFSPEQGVSGKPRFVREGLFVPEVNSPKLPAIRCFVTIDDLELARMVGDAEGPAHTNWTAQTEKFSGKYRYGQQWLTFIKRAPAEILRIVRGEDEEADPTLMAHFFPVPMADVGPKIPEGPKSDPGAGGTRTPPEPPAPRPRRLRVDRIAGGFSAHLTDHGRRRVQRIRIAAAYDRRRGNAFKRWRPEDFDLSAPSFNVDVEGGTVEQRSGNRLTVAVDDSENFSLHVRGFDQNRDLRISAEAEAAA